MRKVVALALFCYFLVLFQTGFLAHFRFFGFFPNLILILVIVLSCLEKKSDWRFLPQNSGIWSALFGGFFLDIFSSDFIGIQMAILLAVSLVIRLLLRKILRLPGSSN